MFFVVILRFYKFNTKELKFNRKILFGVERNSFRNIFKILTPPIQDNTINQKIFI